MVVDLRAPMDGWISPLAEVPDDAFAGGLLGPGLAIDPLADTVCAPAPGEVLAVHAAGHAVTLRLAPGLDVLLHFGLETVRLGGEGFAPLVRVGQQVAAGDALLRVDLGAVVGRAKSLVMPIILIEAEGWQWQPVIAQGLVAKGDVLGQITGAAAADTGAEAGGEALSLTLRVPLAHGLHARPSARLAACARAFDAKVLVEKGAASAAITSPSAMLRLGVGHGDTIRLLARGAQAREALDALGEVIAGGMGEYLAIAEAVAEQAVTHPVSPSVSRAPQPGDRLSGVTAATGIAVGHVWRPRRAEPELAAISQGEAAETALLDGALAGLRATLTAQSEAGTPQQKAILGAHLALLDDEELVGDAKAAIAAGASAAMGWRKVLWAQAEALRQLSDPRFAERAGDLLDLELRLQWQLCGGEPEAPLPPHGAILVAEDLMPSEVAALDLSRVVGLATARGGPTSHVAIIAASRGLPALVALGEGLLLVEEGTPLVLDADGGALEIAPEAHRLVSVRAMIEARAARRAAAMERAHEQGRTSDGTRIEVFANLGKLSEAAPAVANGAEGCGLLRTEFLFLDRQSAPDEDEQTAQYAAIADALEGRPLVIRLLDIGGDKPAPYLPIAAEENPAMGLRGLRVGLARPDVLVTQLRAILRAAVGRPVKIMAPMVARVAELRELQGVAAAQAALLGVDLPEIGVMVETPAAAVMADALAAECAFLSIGTNDLTQYALAMDRGNPAVAAGLDGLDPSVLRLIAQTCAGGARHGKWVGVCGGLASDPLAVPILIGLGVGELSVAPAMVSEIKALVRSVDVADCRSLAARVLEADGAPQVRALAAEFIGGLA
ncbi:phosphoenolpyruvate--protein phosphotransferase [Novosphingobium sp. KACC 22771]|uniref:phosphoenolpyruvate--protein phosphotransferase n=1 Tax=Novosphingobium sp. KACC 22771 TaxID=3025670 RepID=UPI002366BC81|nr:phosphoenolpyruvate--protein phosphotransferase [Novosphingobium sp. KACC 22771]WDF74793.1 phosphoenolpyruvate--protein phosphotransferase [Novosphingobium sp. KACC 22771]